MSLTFSLTFGVPKHILYRALLDEMEMSKTCRCKANIDAKVGGAFDYYNGRIQGKFTKLEKDKLIVQDWKMEDWEKYSSVEFKFME